MQFSLNINYRVALKSCHNIGNSKFDMIRDDAVALNGGRGYIRNAYIKNFKNNV